MSSDELETIALASPPSPPRHRGPFLLALVALVAVVIAGGTLAFVSSEHPARHDATAPAAPNPPAFVASKLGFDGGRFAIVDNGRLEFVDVNGVADATGAPSGDVSIAAANGLSLIVVTMRHWYLVEPDRQPVPLPQGNVFARQAGGWWIVQGGTVGVLGDNSAPTQLPVHTTAIADTPAGMVLQNATSGDVLLWNPAEPTTPPRTVVDANAEVLGVGGDEVVWRPADDGTATVHTVDVAHGNATTIDSPDVTSGADASVAPDGKHVAFYDRSASGTVSVFDTTNGEPLFAFASRLFGTFSPFTAVPGPTGFQPLPFSWTPDGRKLIVLGTLYPVPRVTSFDTVDGLAITTPTSFALDQLAALDAFSPS
jgi:hypothetical protein